MPVIIAAAGEQRKTTAPVISRICAKWPIGTQDRINSRNLGSASAGPVMGVSTQVGATALTRNPRAARECADRGFNVYALTSAFTYYSSHNSDEFPIRNTGNDNVATTLASRQSEVTRWVSSSPFQLLLAA